MITLKESYWPIVQQWQTNSLAVIRPFFFLCLCYIVHRTDYFLMWTDYPSTFWAPNGAMALFSAPFISTYAMQLILWILKLSSMMAAFGLLYPLTATITIGLYFLIVNYSHSFGYQGHVYMPIALIGIPLVISRAAHSFSLDAWLFRLKPNNNTQLVNNAALFNMKLVFCLVFCSAGLSKIMNSGSEWFLTDTLRNYLLRGGALFQDTNPYFKIFSLGQWLYQYPFLCHILAAWTILLELCSPLSLLKNKKWCLFFIPQIALLQIGAVFSIGVNFLPYLCLYIIWIPDLIKVVCDLRKDLFQFRFKKTAEPS